MSPRKRPSLFHVKHRAAVSTDRSLLLLTCPRVPSPTPWSGRPGCLPPRHANYGGGLLQVRRPAAMNLHPVTSVRAYSRCRVPNLARSSASPNREQLTAGVEQGQRPRDEDLQRRDCPRDHHGGRRAQQSRDLRSPAAHHAHPVTNRKSPLNFLEKRERRRMGSTRSTSRSGRANATGIPGSPAPLPRSQTRRPTGIKSATAAQFRT